jgi:hypothetical protein
MSDLLTDLDLAPERETLKEPPKRWRNWWREATGNESPPCDCGYVVFPYEVYPDCPCGGTYPSKDTAETTAREQIAFDRLQYGYDTDEYLGAFPEGERP